MELVEDNIEVRDEIAFLGLLANDLEPLYLPRLPYHNWDEHIAGGLDIIRNLCNEEKAKGNEINTFQALIAYMGHDVGYSHDLGQEKGEEIWQPYGSKESYSSHIMHFILEEYGFDEKFIDGVKTCIMFTQMDSKLPDDTDIVTANTAEVVRTADLSNVFGPYRGFVINSFKLMEEDKVYQRDRDLGEFKNITKFVLNNFLGLGFIPAGKCQTIDGLKNVDRFMKDSPSRLLKAVGNYATRFANLVRKDAA